MNLQEYYNFPEGANVAFSFTPSWYSDKPNSPCAADMSYAFSHYKGSKLPDINTTNTNRMYCMCEYSDIVTLDNIKDWDVSNVTTMEYLFRSCKNLVSVDMSRWNTSNILNMARMFNSCDALKSISAINCSGISTKNNYPLYGTSVYKELTDLGGFIGMKMSWDNGNGLSKCPNLTYESCINILNGLYDFTGNGETPNSNQGTLKVHSNFLTLVGDEISIGTNKGWKITA